LNQANRQEVVCKHPREGKKARKEKILNVHAFDKLSPGSLWNYYLSAPVA